MDTLIKLKQHWIDDGCKVPPGVSNDDVLTFERNHGVIIPADMRSYFLMMDGTGGGMENRMYIFSSLSELRLARDWGYGEITSSTCFVFADVSVDCWAYAIEMSTSGDGCNPVFLLGGAPDRIVAQSFTEFVNIYLTAPEKLDP